jgi:hypothetical protein
LIAKVSPKEEIAETAVAETQPGSMATWGFGLVGEAHPKIYNTIIGQVIIAGEQ